jgi:arylsulfatase A-like enzyme
LFASDDFRGKSLRGIYGDVVEEIDFSVGQVLNTLKDEGLAENTIVVFTSDNGPWLIMNSEGGSAGLLKDGKGSTWEGGMREPCIFWSPGNIKPGVIADLGTTMDLFATFSSLSGLEIPNDCEMDSVDLSSVLFENKASDRNDMFYYRNRELYAVRLGEYKAHFITQGAYGQPAKEYHETPLLYNLNVDPSEKYDISMEHPEVLAEIEKLVEEHDSKMVKGEDQLESRTPN